MKSNFVFYRIIFIGMVAEALVILLKLSNIFDFSWWYTLLPIALTDVVFIVLFIVLYFCYNRKNHEAKTDKNNISKQ